MSWLKSMPANPVVAVAGANGAVGRVMLLTLGQRGFPAAQIKALASARSSGRKLPFLEGELVVEEMTPESFSGVDIALFSAGASISKHSEVLSRWSVKMKLSAFMDAIALIVPSNAHEAFNIRGDRQFKLRLCQMYRLSTVHWPSDGCRLPIIASAGAAA